MSTLQDLRNALRTIRQAPGFSAVVTLTIALGVGTTTAMFGIVDSVLLRPLPYPAQASLVKLFDTNRGRDAAVLSFPEFIDWRDRGSDVFESVGACGASGEALSGAGEAELLLGVQASREVDAIADTITKDRSTTHGLRLRPLATVLVGDLAAPLALLLTAVALLFLIACGNVASLLLARSASRGREFAVRTALGADRGRLVSLVMVESVTRAAVGGLFGIGLAYAIVTLARTMLVGTIPRVATAAIDGRVFAVACGLSLLSGFLFGVTPALRASRRDAIAGLSGARGSVEHGSRDGVRRTLMVGEIALSFVLLVAAALLVESYLRLVHVPKGFNPDGLITARVYLPPSRYAAEAAQNAFFDGLTQRLARDFGPRAVTLASDLPSEGGTSGGVGLTSPGFPDVATDVEQRIVSSNYVDVLKAQLVRGRFLQPSDVRGNQPVVVVNETFARVWLEGDPIGQNVAFSWGIDGTQTVVGVVADVREGGLDEQPKAAIYIAGAQRPHFDMRVLVRTSRTMSEAMNLIRASVAGLDAALPVIDVRSADDIVAAGARPQQLIGQRD